MDWTNIVIGGLSLFGTLAGAYFANQKSTALISYRIEQLEKKVDQHNTVIDRTYKLEKRADLCDEKLKVANNRIADLEKGE